MLNTGKAIGLSRKRVEAFGSFTRIRPTIGVITNIDPEHLDHYKTFDNLRDAFRAYLQNLPFYGLVLFASMITKCKH